MYNFIFFMFSMSLFVPNIKMSSSVNLPSDLILKNIYYIGTFIFRSLMYLAKSGFSLSLSFSSLNSSSGTFFSSTFAVGAGGGGSIGAAFGS